jgi:hypothetical protein
MFRFKDMCQQLMRHPLDAEGAAHAAPTFEI